MTILCLLTSHNKPNNVSIVLAMCEPWESVTCGVPCLDNVNSTSAQQRGCCLGNQLSPSLDKQSLIAFLTSHSIQEEESGKTRHHHMVLTYLIICIMLHIRCQTHWIQVIYKSLLGRQFPCPAKCSKCNEYFWVSVQGRLIKRTALVIPTASYLTVSLNTNA